MWPVKSSECFNKTDVMSQPASRRRHCACSLWISAGGCLRFNLTRMILHLNKARLRRFPFWTVLGEAELDFSHDCNHRGCRALIVSVVMCSILLYKCLPAVHALYILGGWVEDWGVGGVSYFRGQTQTSLIISVMHQIPGAPLNFRPA